MYKTYIQGLLDYGSQVWAPIKPALILHLESVQRLYTIQTEGLQNCNYWIRLKNETVFSTKE